MENESEEEINLHFVPGGQVEGKPPNSVGRRIVRIVIFLAFGGAP